MRRSNLELFQKIGPFLWTIDGGTGMYWNNPARSRRVWSATRPTHNGWERTASGETMASKEGAKFRNLTYIEFCEEYGLDPMQDEPWGPSNPQFSGHTHSYS